MKSTGQNQESPKKKQAGEYLKNADRLLKQAEFEAALEDVERCLELDPGNFYAHAYKERIIALRTKHQQQAAHAAPQAAPAPPLPPPPAAHDAPPPAAAKAGPPAEKPAERHAPAKQPEHPAALTQEEARKKFLEEKRRSEEELRKQSEEARRRAEEELRRRAQELEAMHNTESLERRKALEEEKRKKEQSERRSRPAEEERAKLETDARRKAEEIARKKLEEDIQARNVGQKQASEETDALHAAEADGKARAKEQKLYDYLLEAKDLLEKKNFAEAVIPLLKMTTLDKGHAEAVQMLTGIREINQQSWATRLKDAEAIPRENVLAIYRNALAIAWKAGTPDAPVAEIIKDLRGKLKITDAEHAEAEPQAKRTAYNAAVSDSLTSGASPADAEAMLAQLRKDLGVTDEEARK